MKQEITTSTILLFAVAIIISAFWLKEIKINKELKSTIAKNDTINIINKKVNDSIITILQGDYQKEFVIRSKNLNNGK